MRTLVEPPPRARCDDCRGELRLKQVIESVNPNLDWEEVIFICVKCGREKSYTVSRDRNKPHLIAG